MIGPGESVEEHMAINPYLETRPYVGFTPTTPHQAAGPLMLPAVSLPVTKIHIFAETAAAEPADDPPGILVQSHGLVVC
ncbi:MAG: hypothetical protein ACD_22C00027G0004 [uncultured bacterium]|nr:MAG: hypothetical protein ACD_22C00027G0004 [uncultured bacterium]